MDLKVAQNMYRLREEHLSAMKKITKDFEHLEDRLKQRISSLSLLFEQELEIYAKEVKQKGGW